ncbi:holin family protein [Sphingomonas sp.]|uniref:holin family protein n=1 Tax=Sphingomonas sp. TaxID=28214 RepID=UPI001ED05E61|nr:holin family protein [Sphingomonas sp.]MBX3592919.1 holin family protein [Sphingomonas sp.]
MALLDGLIGPIAGLIDKIIPDPKARDAAKLELIRLEGSQELERVRTQLSAIVAEAQSPDPWTSRARPSFLYVMYALLLWAIPMGLIGAVAPDMAKGIAAGMNAYLNGLPEPLYALFGTGYLGYTAARQWGKVKGVEK